MQHTVSDSQDTLNSNSNISKDEAINAIRVLLGWIGEDPSRQDLIETPNRVLNSFNEFFSGYKIQPATLLQKTFQNTYRYTEPVILKDIAINSYCEHHMVPFTGVAHIAYIPNERIVGISKLARVAEAYARRLQVQERLTMEIARTVEEALQPHGVAVIIEALHQCIATRGAHQPNVKMVTTAMLGRFDSDQKLRAEFFNMCIKK
ncbi:GTP cyclohydrolase I FolE [Rickettsiales endosymbiont of Peranema trichophorum]|uniref:GTP cyclohydrolase I FolE n=1 Tax=Rickettsiales endosymbiont of Peranema trichophorum TaxID=2486577 RepID=UPI001022C01F|nr:GTP cyclohydrolase I FolE [Rickettsiales endosymbiont of Peranema trichophorum]RZI46712.1 GTP cyclohydrolase I FolE [Rickettsiales endosymbiont of Peranema trichophorum]